MQSISGFVMHCRQIVSELEIVHLGLMFNFESKYCNIETSFNQSRLHGCDIDKYVLSLVIGIKGNCLLVSFYPWMELDRMCFWWN